MFALRVDTKTEGTGLGQDFMDSKKNQASTRPQRLRLDADQMRQLGYAAVDQVVDQFAAQSQCEGRVVPWTEPGEPPSIHLSEFAAEGKQASAVLDEVRTQVLPQCMDLMHPRYFAYIPGPSNFISALGDFLSSGHNVFAGVSTHNLGSYVLEDAVVNWLCELMGFDEKATGLFVSGGSAASLTALLAARTHVLQDHIDGAVVYYSDQTHSSVGRALSIMGIGDRQIRVLPSDSTMRLDPGRLKAAISEDAGKGLRPFCVVANAGTTSSGAVDRLDAIADVCQQAGLWLHVDAAYGGGAMLSPSVRSQFNGIARADTIAIDPHKWLFQPFECAAVLTRHSEILRETFRRVPDYMKDTDTGFEVPNYRDMGIQVTRGFKALKLWMSLQVFGIDAFRDAVEAGLALAKFAQAELESRPEFEVVTPATLGVVTYRYVDDRLDQTQADALNDWLCGAISQSGYAFVSGTALKGHRVQRLCPTHPNATQADITHTLDRIVDLAAGRLAERAFS